MTVTKNILTVNDAIKKGKRQLNRENLAYHDKKELLSRKKDSYNSTIKR
jgi:hypothetical protein